jgi:hypothetical protein
MKNCFCPYGVCARERGYMPPSEKNLMCKQKVVVPRHEPILDFGGWWIHGSDEGQEHQQHHEPIEDES